MKVCEIKESLKQNPDAKAWADEFVDLYEQEKFIIDEDSMYEWFSEFFRTSHDFLMHPNNDR